MGVGWRRTSPQHTAITPYDRGRLVNAQTLSSSPILAFASGKGGTAKSTLALAVAAEMSARGAFVTAIDLDPQAGLTDYAGLDPVSDPLVAESVTVHGVELYRGGRPLVQATEQQVSAHVARARNGHAGPLIADLSPAWGDHPHRVLLGRPETVLVLAVRLDGGGLRAARELTAVAEQRGIPYRIVPTFDKRWAVSKTVLHGLRAFFGDRVTDTTVPEDVKASEAVSAGQPVTTYAPRSRAAQAVRALVDELEGGQ